MRSLNPDQLRAFLTVIAAASFSRAADRLALSPSAVSLQISALEERLGVILVERLGKRAQPTPAGHALVGHATAILRQMDLAAEAMRAYADGGLGSVRLGTGTAALAYLLPPLLRRLKRSHPGLELSIGTDTTDAMVAQIRANDIDLGLLTLPIDDAGLVVTVLREDPLVAVFPAGTPDLPRAATPQTFAGLTLVTDNAGSRLHEFATGWLRTGGVEPAHRMELGSIEAIRNVVASGIGAALLPVELLASRPPVGGIVTRPLRPRLTRTLALVQRRDKPDNPALAAVRDLLLALRVSPPGNRSRSRGRPG